jgi:hypothetical protein
MSHSVGPILHPSHLSTSPQIIRDIMTGTFPAIPDLGFLVVDVRDVARVRKGIKGNEYIYISDYQDDYECERTKE